MNANRIRHLFLAAPLIIAGMVPAFADESSVNQSIDQLLGDHTKYQAVIIALQKAVAAQDAKGVAAMVSYPIGVKINGKETNVKSAAAFEKHYSGIITPRIAKAVTDQKYGDLFVNYQGVMFGDGQVWISGICTDNDCKNFDVKVETIQDGPN
ncbi:hypothetical protein [Sinorhizobium sp. RAC02]|uniref:hypothetical protein n=1 Tax=Sinorhizobium sp. RAC02 TaxID=1842534 RepID=UPI00083E078E|nr:hypothetical protein [Sinorhizobium sp. RAC02]AOF88390.1 hypothetical protein BSY16_2106 [Sinorhizobium sp. RAC02]